MRPPPPIPRSVPHPADVPPLTGGFIQFDDTVLDHLDEQDWVRLLARFRVMGLRTLILQRLGLAVDNGPVPPRPMTLAPPRALDPVPMILSTAAEMGMEVFLGLLEPPPETNMRPGYWSVDNLSQFAEANVRFAADLARRYPGAAGWYVALENWVGNYRDESPEHWRDFYARVSAGCKAVADRPVAISPGLPTEVYRVCPEEAAESYARVLDGSGLDIVMLQDSVGAKPEVWQPATVAPYAQALQQVCRQQGRQFWMNLENFEPASEGGFQPCTPERLQAQLAAAPADARRVTFDCLHYMSGVVRLPGWTDLHWCAMLALARHHAAPETA